ncbi:MAG: hypothetical protein A2622_07610 [Bdellovibrionales bacterium RIFCSPHIGHO2_01_FULL_40_29]|nr:MAG: hypothetical protein A2622_07610 [Bdellovibrionales bacterium RIFCSPHIGHO2_01_FULL_40_29]OFZ34212.1 MAG: hypothetical protein A3D17_04040 [Bdellovibrionales bacterium RIFCSPHIGHO2_02_FULL_40_15]
MLFVIGFLLHLNAFAAIPAFEASEILTLTSEQVPFFKSPQSQFPSGYTSLANLQKKQIEQVIHSENAYVYQNEYFKKEDLKPIFPMHMSQSVLDPKSKRRWSVLEAKVETLLVYDTNTKETHQFRIQDVTPDPYDLGFALTLKDIFLKKEPSEKAQTLTTVPQGHKFSVLKYSNGFAQVSYKTYIGFIPVSEIVTKFDFATYVFANAKWYLVKKRHFDHIITAENRKFHFDQIKGLITPDKVGLIASKNQKIPLWSRVAMIPTKGTTWIQSRIKGHGDVWWRSEMAAPEKVYTIDELLKKEIASISFHPTNPLKAIVSARGAYITEDGYLWRLLPDFKTFHGPVHYFSDHMIFIGNFRSLDGAKTFENYIQLERLTVAIQNQLGFLPKRLQVKRINTLPNYQLKIEIETGHRRIQLQSPLFTQSWRVIKS